MRRKWISFWLFAASGASVIAPGCRSENSAQSTPAIQSPPSTQLTTTAPATDEVIAHVNGVAVTRRELDRPLIDAYGLKMLLILVQVDLAKQVAARDGVKVTPQDILDERNRTFTKLFTDAPKEKYPQLLDQFLKQQNLNSVELDLVLETNAYLRKIAEPQLPGKITDAEVHLGFSQLYGENRQIRDIELSNIREVAEAKQRLQTQPFELVAREMSRDRRTAANGGELPAFSAQSQNIPDEIKSAAFSLPLDQVSDALQVQTSYHLIKVTGIIPPKIVKYEDVKDSVRATLEDQWIQFAITTLRNQLRGLAVQTLQINDPTLAAKWKEQLDQSQSRTGDRVAILKDLNRSHQQAATQPTTAATTQPQATMPGAAAPGTLPATRP